MADNIFRGGSASVAQVCTATPANVEATDIFNLILTDDGGRTATVSFEATGTTVANVTAGLTAAWNASADPFVSRITAVDSTTHVTLTADVAGVPFTLTSSTTDGGGANTQTLVVATTTASSSTNDVGVAANWSLKAIPTTGDHIIFNANSPSAYYGLNQSGVSCGKITVESGFGGQIGLVRDGFLYYLRYGTGANAVRIGGTGSLVAIDMGSGTGVVHISHTGSNGSEKVVWVKSTGFALIENVGTAPVGIGAYVGDAATISGARIDNLGGGFIQIGHPHNTITTNGSTTLNSQNGGTSTSYAAVPVLNLYEDAVHRQEAGDITTGSLFDESELYMNGIAAQAVTTLNIENEALIGREVNGATVTIGTTNVRGRGTTIPPAATTWVYTNAPAYTGSGPAKGDGYSGTGG